MLITLQNHVQACGVCDKMIFEAGSTSAGLASDLAELFILSTGMSPCPCIVMLYMISYCDWLLPIHYY